MKWEMEAEAGNAAGRKSLFSRQGSVIIVVVVTLIVSLVTQVSLWTKMAKSSLSALCTYMLLRKP